VPIDLRELHSELGRDGLAELVREKVHEPELEAVPVLLLEQCVVVREPDDLPRVVRAGRSHRERLRAPQRVPLDPCGTRGEPSDSPSGIVTRLRGA